MNENSISYVDIIKDALIRKQQKNKNYSLRAMARDLEMPASTLSLVLKGKRELPRKKFDLMVKFLDLSPINETYFKESYYQKRTSIDSIKIRDDYYRRVMIDENHYNILAQWEYYAVLSLIECENFESDHRLIASRLGIKKERVDEVMRGLIAANLILLTHDGRYVLTKGPLRTTEDINSRALKESHLETLEIAKNKIEEIAVELRDFSSMTIAVDPTKIQDAKTIIREFRQKIGTLLRDGKKQEVYQLAIQLYPLSNAGEMNKKTTNRRGKNYEL